MRILSHRPQRTLLRPAIVTGVGFLTGRTIRLRFLPAATCTGVVFVRTDCHPAVAIPASVDRVTGTARRTTLGAPPHEVGLVEHVLAALAGLRIDNCRIELDGPEPPGLDGSSRGFVDALLGAGVQMQDDDRLIWTVDETIVVRQGNASLTIHPADEDDAGLKITYFLDYGPLSPIHRQSHTQIITPESFRGQLANARTFVLESEVAELRRMGLGARTTAADLLVFGPHGPIDNRLRNSNEPARHKTLDVVGDLSLLGADLRGHVIACRSGHEQNVELAGILRQNMTCDAGRARLVA